MSSEPRDPLSQESSWSADKAGGLEHSPPWSDWASVSQNGNSTLRSTRST